MNFACSICLSFLILSPFLTRAQEHSYAGEFERLMAEMDSLSIFNLLDSTLSAATARYSELNIRAAYSSNVAVAGRNYGINQHGFSPGVSYYHKSGMYGDVTGYWNSAYDPNYNLTMLSMGYFGSKNNFSFIPSYERWIYNDDSSATLFNSLGLSLSQNIKFLNAGIDYSFLFGSETAHRLIFSGSGYISFRDVWFFDAISIMPAIGVLFGNDEVTKTRFTDENVPRIGDTRLGDLSSLYSLSTNYSINVQQTWLDYRYERVQNSNLKPRVKQYLLSQLDVYQSNLTSNGTLLDQQVIKDYESGLFSTEHKNVFGLMNWNFSIPVFFTIDQFNISVSYSYNLPLSLPGEVISFDPISYFSTSITYRIPFKN